MASIRVFRWPGDNSVYRVPGGERPESLRKTLLERHCTGKGPQGQFSGFCELVRWRTSPKEMEFSRNELAEANHERLSALSARRTQAGENLLMVYLRTSCVAPEAVGGSGFSSGADPLAEKKRRVFRSILERTGDLQAKDFSGRSALYYAAYYGCREEAEVLEQRGVAIPPRDHSGVPFLQYALFGGVPVFLDKGFDLLAPEDLGPIRDPRLTAFLNSSPSFPVRTLSRDTLIAVAESGRPELLSRLLQRKDQIERRRLIGLINWILEKADEKLFDVLLEHKVDFWHQLGGTEQHLILSYLGRTAGSHTSGNEKFRERLESIFSGERKNIASRCENSASPDACFSSIGACERISMQLQRDTCFEQKGMCQELGEQARKWRCLGRQNPDGVKEICKEAKPKLENALCRITVLGGARLDKKEKEALLDLLLSSQEGFESLRTIGGRLGEKTGDPSEGRRMSERCIRSSFAARVYGHELGYSLCSGLAPSVGISNEPGLREEIRQCGTKGKWDKCAFPILVGLRGRTLGPGSDGISAEVRNALSRLCKEGSPESCAISLVVSPWGIPGDQKEKAETLACDFIPASRFCNSRLQFLDNKDAAKADLLRAQLVGLGEFQHVPPLLNRIGAKQLDVSLLAPALPALEVQCQKGMIFCELAYMVSKGLNRKAGSDRILVASRHRLETSCRSGQCEANRSWVLKEPMLLEVVKGYCMKGEPQACLSIQSANLGDIMPKLTLQAVVSGCGKRPNVPRSQCIESYAQVFQRSQKNADLLVEICRLFDLRNHCEPVRRAVLSKLAHDKELEGKIGGECHNDGYEGACALLGEYFRQFAPEQALPFLERACELSRGQGKSCGRHLHLLTKMKRLGEVEALFNARCPGQLGVFCSRRSAFLMVAGGPAIALAELETPCRAGNQLSCELLRDYYRSVGKEKEIQELKGSLCRGGPYSPICATGWELQETGRD
jgi:hypothetical protein